jgi:hypothetical protein
VCDVCARWSTTRHVEKTYKGIFGLDKVKVVWLEHP